MPIGSGVQAAALALAAQMIPHFEGWRAMPYWDSYGRCWSQGFGFCTLEDGSYVTAKSPAMSLSQGQRLLALKLQKDYLPEVLRRLGQITLTSGQLAAVLSFAWNEGGPAITKAGLPQVLKLGDFAKAAELIRPWNKGGGQVLGGLVTRRMEEGEMLMGAKWPLAEAHPVAAARLQALPRAAAPTAQATEDLNQQSLDNGPSFS